MRSMNAQLFAEFKNGESAGFAHGFQPALMFSAARTAYSVLVVDDDRAKRDALAHSLSAAGYRVTEAFSGAEALERYASHAAVVLDVHLPDVLGFDVCRVIKASMPGIIVVQVSSVFVDDQFRQAGFDAGADAYLADPAAAPLLEVLDRLLRCDSGT